MTLIQRIRMAARCLRGEVPGGRRRLPDKRACEHITFEHDNHIWTASIGGFESGGLAEIFLTANKSGSKIEALAQDAAIMASIALQYGAPSEVLRHAITRDGRGEPHGALGAALDMLSKETTS